VRAVLQEEAAVCGPNLTTPEALKEVVEAVEFLRASADLAER